MPEPTLTHNVVTLVQLRPYYINNSNKEDLSTHYYDHAFQQILEGKRPRINWAAGFMSTLWAVYRRQYELAFVISLIFMVLGTLETVILPSLQGLSLFLSIVLFFVLAFNGNTYYFNAIKKKVEIGITPTQPSNNTDKQGVFLLIVYSITAYLLTFNAVVGPLRNAEISNTEANSQPAEELLQQILKFNWIGFILLWSVLYIWKIHPERTRQK